MNIRMHVEEQIMKEHRKESPVNYEIYLFLS